MTIKLKDSDLVAEGTTLDKLNTATRVAAERRTLLKLIARVKNNWEVEPKHRSEIRVRHPEDSSAPPISLMIPAILLLQVYDCLLKENEDRFRETGVEIEADLYT